MTRITRETPPGVPSTRTAADVPSVRHSAAVFAGCALAVATADWASKALATSLLGQREIPVFGEVVRLALVLNDQSAFGVSLGPYTWHINIALTALALALSAILCPALTRIDVWAPIMLGLIAGAAAGNLVSMLSSPHGVVDFVAVSRGDGRELVFNLADVAAVLGLILIVRTGTRVIGAIRRGG